MKTMLVLNEDGTVNAICDENGTIVTKEITLSAVADLFMEAMKDQEDTDLDNWFISPAFPPKTVAYKQNRRSSSFVLAIDWGPDILPFQYENTLFQAVPFPRLLIALSGEKDQGKKEYRISRIFVTAVKGMDPITDNTRLYHYPFSHVAGTQMCYGINQLPRTKSLVEMQCIPRVVLTIPNGTHHYDESTNRSKKPLRELLENLDGKKSFPERYLAPLKIAFSDWFSSIV